ncbi:MAG TPA: hypothetical protein VEU08_19500, partial [Vicinamibacterales bacterium]|nr:hypothetical protein [Vicinamibacterales bacterium]
MLAAATGTRWGDPVIVDETLDPIDPETIVPGDVVGIGIHTGNALRGYEIGRLARERGASVVYGGIHATLYPDEAHENGAAHAVVRGDGDLIWQTVVADCIAGQIESLVDVLQAFLRHRFDADERAADMRAAHGVQEFGILR